MKLTVENTYMSSYSVFLDITSVAQQKGALVFNVLFHNPIILVFQSSYWPKHSQRAISFPVMNTRGEKEAIDSTALVKVRMATPSLTTACTLCCKCNT